METKPLHHINMDKGKPTESCHSTILLYYSQGVIEIELKEKRKFAKITVTAKSIPILISRGGGITVECYIHKEGFWLRNSSLSFIPSPMRRTQLELYFYFLQSISKNRRNTKSSFHQANIKHQLYVNPKN